MYALLSLSFLSSISLDIPVFTLVNDPSPAFRFRFSFLEAFQKSVTRFGGILLKQVCRDTRDTRYASINLRRRAWPIARSDLMYLLVSILPSSFKYLPPS